MQPTIIIYSSPSCAYCHQAKEYFKEKELEYTEKDITTDLEAMRFVVEKVGQAVTPIITLDEDIVVGFDRPRIEEILDQFHASDSTKAA